jgi:hypothetical protein
MGERCGLASFSLALACDLLAYSCCQFRRPLAGRRGPAGRGLRRWLTVRAWSPDAGATPWRRSIVHVSPKFLRMALAADPQRAFGGDQYAFGIDLEAAMPSFSRCAVHAC